MKTDKKVWRVEYSLSPQTIRITVMIAALTMIDAIELVTKDNALAVAWNAQYVCQLDLE